MLNDSDIIRLIDVAMGYVKDRSLEETLHDLAQAQRAYYTAKADQNRNKAQAIINSMAQLDLKVKQLELEYARLKAVLSQEGRQSIESLIEQLQVQRKQLLDNKKQLARQ